MGSYSRYIFISYGISQKDGNKKKNNDCCKNKLDPACVSNVRVIELSEKWGYYDG